MRVSVDLLWALICCVEAAKPDCADPRAYMKSAQQDQYLQLILRQYHGKCVVPWFADTLGNFVDEVYYQDGPELGHELALAFHQVWVK